MTVLAGYLPNPKLTVAATGIMIQTTSLMYTVPMALAGCVSARVSCSVLWTWCLELVSKLCVYGATSFCYIRYLCNLQYRSF